MRQFALPSQYDGSGFLSVTGDDYHYLSRVLRLHEGDSLPAIDHNGERYTLTIIEKENGKCRVSVHPEGPQRTLRKETERQSPDPRITLFQCIPKGKKMDLVVRQAVEAGVRSIYPVVSEHTVPKIQAENRLSKQERWDRIVEEAVQQSGSSTITGIHGPIPLGDIPRVWNCTEQRLGLVFHEKLLEKNSLHDYLSDSPNEIGIVIGPEGGLSSKEVDLLTGSGFNLVYLGNNVLRTETASLYAVSAVTITYRERSSWKLRR
jgi:16S rRNA (uracil1498-N3)-methyltransferase